MSNSGSWFNEHYHHKHTTLFERINSSKTYVLYGVILILWNKLLMNLTQVWNVNAQR